MMEPLLTPNTSRYVNLPKHDDIRALYKKHVASFWTVEELDIAPDLDHWEHKLDNSERKFISQILAFFAPADGIVVENTAINFLSEIQLSEAREFYGFQIAMENIHAETYRVLIETYIKDKTECDELLHSLDHFPFIKKKTDWSIKWMDNSLPFAKRLVAFACVEGIFFSGAFCSIFWLKKRGLMHGLTHSNELISKDEALHTEFAILLYSKMVNKLSESEIHMIIKEAVEIETEFICDALPCRLIGMNSKLMSEYIRFVADRLVVQLGYSKIYGAANPFDFMEYISMEQKVNFFENRVSDYSLANTQKSHDVFLMDDDSF